MENSDSIKITFAKNLNKLNFNTTISMPIDTNVNIKTILDVNSYLYDETVECGNGKAILSAKIGLKVLYIDTDNMTNTIVSSQSISETFSDGAITSDCYINVMNSSIANNILSSDGTLKVNCDVNISPIMYVNLGLNNNINSIENMIVKKNEISTTTISNVVDSRVDYTTNFETKDNISKILSYNSYFCPNETRALDGVAMVEGKLYSSLLYETMIDDESVIKELKDSFNVRFDINIEGLDKDSSLDLTYSLDRASENISTEIEDDNSIIIVTHKIRAVGIAVKNITIDIVDDMFSTENELDLNLATRDYFKISKCETIHENISNEITISDDESAIDQVLSNLNISPEITNSYIKDDTLYIEGIIISHLVYIDENKEYQKKQTEIPFIINTKIAMHELSCTHTTINVEDCKYKVKRGTIIELEYLATLNVCMYEKETKEIVDNISIGKSLDFSAYDYQIYLAKPNETIWQLCKRIRITPERLRECNHDLPDVMIGGEKVIIKR